MKKWGGLLVVLLLATRAEAQVGVYIQQTPTMLQAATAVGTSATTGGVITLTPSSGNFVYVTAIEITNCNGTGAISPATPLGLTAGGIVGTPVWNIGSGAAAGLCQPSTNITFPSGLRGISAGTAVTFTLPAFISNQIVRANVYWYQAP